MIKTLIKHLTGADWGGTKVTRFQLLRECLVCSSVPASQEDLNALQEEEFGEV